MRCAGRSAGASSPSNLSASGSYVFVIGRARRHVHALLRLRHRRPRLGLLQLLLRRPARRGPRRPDPAPGRALGRAAEDRWARSPRRSPSRRPGIDAVHRILRVEGIRNGHSGYWERDVADPPAAGWTFHRTDLPVTGKRLANRRARYVAARPRPRREPPLRDEGGRRAGDASQLQRLLLAVAPGRPRPRQRDPLASLHRRRPAPGAARPRPRRPAARAVRRDSPARRERSRRSP